MEYACALVALEVLKIYIGIEINSMPSSENCDAAKWQSDGYRELRPKLYDCARIMNPWSLIDWSCSRF